MNVFSSLFKARDIPDEQGGNLYLINGNMTKLQDAGIFAASIKKEKEELRK